MDPIKAQVSETEGMRQQAEHENQGGMGRLGGSPGAFVFASAIGPRIPLAPPDSGGAGGGGEGGGTGGEGGAGGDINAGGEGGNGGTGGDGGGQPPVRPEFIPEDWWDADKGFKAEDFNALIARDAERASELAQVPESADKYQAKLPHDFKLPDGVKVADGESLIDENDPRIAVAREFAHANGFNQAQFEGLIAMGVNLDLAEQTRLTEAVNAQIEALGPKGKERVGAVKSWVSSKLPAEQAEAILATLYTKTQVEAFEALMRLNRGAVPGNPGAGRDAGKSELSDEEYDKMSPTERINYARQNSKK